MAHVKEQLLNLRVRTVRGVEASRKHSEQSELMVVKLSACCEEEPSVDAQGRELGALKAHAELLLRLVFGGRS